MGRGECHKLRRHPVEISLVDSFISLVPRNKVSRSSLKGLRISVLFQVELLKLAQIFFFGFPHSVHYILDIQNEIGLAVSCISEGHVGRICLRDRRQRQMGWPCLDQDHVACYQTCGIRPTSRISSAPEYNCFVIVGWVTQDLMKLHRESVEMTNV